MRKHAHVIIALAMLTLLRCGDEQEKKAACTAPKIDCNRVCIEPIAPTLASIHAEIFKPSCTFNACHGAVSPKEGLDLSSVETAYANLLTASAQMPSMQLVSPGKPEDSYLINKLTGQAMAPRSSSGQVSVRMPLGGALCEPKMEAIREWIRAGAPR